MTSISTSDATVSDWLRANALPLAGTESDHEGDDLDALVDRLAPARVIGLGESTRFSRETYGIRERLFRALVLRHGVRALAIQDGARSGERLDAYVLGGEGTAEAALDHAWRPLRTRETVATLDWIRAYNRDHPGDPVTVFGVEPPRAELADYAAIKTFLAARAPELADAVEAHLAPIRTAHRIDEHVQRHRGIHPGRPFAEHAREAVALLESLPAGPERDAALAHARFILEFHENSVAGQRGFGRDELPTAERILAYAERKRIVYWDGISHVAARSSEVGGAAESFVGTGAHLRERLGADYLAVAIGFHHGDLGLSVAPDPGPDLVDAALGTVGLPAFAVDLGTDAPVAVDRWRRAPARLRVISGMYDPAREDEATMTVPALADAFDILVQVRETSPVAWLPDPGQ